MVETHRLMVESEARRAGFADLLEVPVGPGQDPLFLPKYVVLSGVWAISRQELTHVSGGTGTGKTTYFDALDDAKTWFAALRLIPNSDHLMKPLKRFRIETCRFETPGEVWSRRALVDGNTRDEPSDVVSALIEAEAAAGEFHPCIHLQELGGVLSANVQRGFLDLMVQGNIHLPDGRTIDGTKIAWIADSNYAALATETHSIVQLDDALRRRMRVNIRFDSLSKDQAIAVLMRIARDLKLHVDPGVIVKIVEVGQAITRYKSEGQLSSIAPASIYGYKGAMRLINDLGGEDGCFSLAQCLSLSVLGNCSAEDAKVCSQILSSTLGLRGSDDEDAVDDISIRM